MDIEGMGYAVVSQLVSTKRLKTFADIYTLTKDDLLKLELFKDRKADNLLNAIENSKKQPLSRLLFGLGVRNVGEKAAWVLAQRFGTIDKLMAATLDDLTAINEIGPIMAQSIYDFFCQDSVKKLINQMLAAGINMAEPRNESKSKPFEGKTIVLTGELKALSRIEAENKVRELGGNPSSSVSRKTDFVVVGEEPGSKYDKAMELGVRIVREQEFLKMIK